MAGFHPSELREEERVGGFTPQDTEELFALETLLGYPTDDTSPQVEEEYAEQEVPALEEESVDTTEEDLFAFEEEQNIELPEEDLELPLEDFTEELPIASDADDLFGDPVGGTPTPAQEQAEEESVQLDEDFLNSLRSDLQKAEVQDEPDIDLDILPEAQAQTPVDDVAPHDDVEIDITDLIDADHPSTFGIPKVVSEEAAPVVASEQKAPQEKKKKRRILGMPIAVAASVLLTTLAGSVGGGLYFFAPGLVPGIGTMPNDSTANPTTTVVDSTGGPYAEAKQKDTAQATPRTGYRGMPIEDETADSVVAPTDDTEKIPEVPAPKPVEKNVTPKAEAAKDNTAKNSETSSKPSVLDKKQSPATERKKPQAAPKEETEVATNAVKPKPVVSEKKVAPKPVHSTTKPERNSPESIVMPAKPSEAGLFVVQIFSSPSKADAEAWRDKLRKRGIPYVTVEEQTIRDNKWYRVRFGRFDSQAEAEQEAKRLQFSNCWVVRVR